MNDSLVIGSFLPGANIISGFSDGVMIESLIFSNVTRSSTGTIGSRFSPGGVWWRKGGRLLQSGSRFKRTSVELLQTRLVGGWPDRACWAP